MFIATLLWYAGFTVLTGASVSLSMVVVLRFVTGLGVGAEYAVINAAIAEFMPARVRGRAGAAVMNFWAIGAIAAGLLAFLLLNTFALAEAVSWRYGFALGGVLALLVLFFRRRLPESPRWLASQGRNAEAAPLYERSLAISEKALGAEHPDVAATLNNLAGVYDAQGRYDDAESLYERALAIRERVLGPDYEIVEIGFDIPFAGAVNQPWHRDFPSPRETWQKRRLTSLAFNLTAVDTTAEMGPFEIAPGTHWEAGREFAHQMFPAKSEWPRFAALGQKKLPQR